MIWALRTISRFLAMLPLRWALALGRCMGWVFGSVIRYHRREAEEALARSLPELSAEERRRVIRRMYANLGMNLVEILRLPHADEAYFDQYVTRENEEHLRKALAGGKGVLVLTAHMGNWDLLCTLAPHFNYPTTIITKEIKNKALNEYWMTTRARFGLKFVPAHNSFRLCLAALRRNEIVGVILDQNMIDTEGIFVDFFGRPACTTPGLAYLSAQSGAPVVPVYMLREGGRHVIRILPPVLPPPDRKPETIRVFTQQYTRLIEDMIRAHPAQWTWIHRRWRTQPRSL